MNTIANSLINSHILYLAPLWAQTTESNIAKVQKAQTRALRQISWTARTNYGAKPHRQQMFSKWWWLNTQQLLERATIQLVIKARNNKSSDGINQMFTTNDSSRQRPANRHKIQTINTRKRNTRNILDKGRNSFNHLPLYLREPNLKPLQHKKELKKHIELRHLLPEHWTDYHQQELISCE